jgi:hypothetical protein
MKGGNENPRSEVRSPKQIRIQRRMGILSQGRARCPHRAGAELLSRGLNVIVTVNKAGTLRRGGDTAPYLAEIIGDFAPEVDVKCMKSDFGNRHRAFVRGLPA